MDGLKIWFKTKIKIHKNYSNSSFCFFAIIIHIFWTFKCAETLDKCAEAPEKCEEAPDIIYSSAKF